MKKKIVSLCLVVCLLAVAIVGGTMAYFTDTKEATNTFTIGSVKIDLLESTLHRQNDNATDNAIIADAANYAKYLEENGENMVPGRWVKKAPYVHNTGDNAAYVRIKMTIHPDVFKLLDMTLYTTAYNAGEIVMDNGVTNSDDTVTYTFTYTKALEPGEVTYYAPFWRFKIKDELNNDAIEKLSAIDKQIVVVAEAIQSEGFDGYEAAFKAYDNQGA